MPEAAVFNRVDIDLAALVRNYRRIAARCGTSLVMAVVKSDAYGHGLVPCARALAAAGCGVFGVAEAEEGVALREAGITGDIVVLLGIVPEAAAAVAAHRLAPVVYDPAAVEALAAAASRAGRRVGVHLKVDCGMGRLGVAPEEAAGLAARITASGSLFLAGIMSHFPMADTSHGESRRNLECFLRVCGTAAGKGVLRHMANSAAIIREPDSFLDMVRPGLGLYGCYPVADEDRAALPGLEPVMRFATRVAQIKRLPAGCGISYGHTYTTGRDTRVAVLPVGYDDGYLRRLSNRARVLIRGRRVPVIGRVCMNACMVDVTAVPEAAPGDEAVLLGRQGGDEIEADELAAWMDTISYEVLCLFGARNPRFYHQDENNDGKG